MTTTPGPQVIAVHAEVHREDPDAIERLSAGSRVETRPSGTAQPERDVGVGSSQGEVTNETGIEDNTRHDVMTATTSMTTSDDQRRRKQTQPHRRRIRIVALSPPRSTPPPGAEPREVVADRDAELGGHDVPPAQQGGTLDELQMSVAPSEVEMGSTMDQSTCFPTWGPDSSVPSGSGGYQDALSHIEVRAARRLYK
jgi:hypothetical protein